MNVGRFGLNRPTHTANHMTGRAFRRLTTMRIITPVLLLSLAPPLPAAEPKVHRDLAYAEPKNKRQTLDVYAPAGGKNQPIVVWIHDGGWQAGDKKEVQKKPQAFV